VNRSVESEDIEVAADAGIDGKSQAYAARRIAFCLRRLPASSAKARVRLTSLPSDKLARPALAQARLEVDGQYVRAQLAAASVDVASQRLGERLDLQLTQFCGAPRPRPWPDHGDSFRPEPVPIDPGHREIVRRKTCRPDVLSPQQAATAMDVRDYDFHLFIDIDSHQDSLVFRVGPTGYRLTQLKALPPHALGGVVPITIDAHPVPRGTPEEIAARLDETEMAHRFFLDTTTRRGAVLYRRYDGHYGLLSPEGC
jgi:hypothetical protein